MIELENLHIGYGDVVLIEDAHIQSGKSKIIALLGRNGSGKSTLLKTLAGLQKPLKGNIRIEQICIKNYTNNHLHIAAVFQFNDALLQTDVYSFISFGRYHHAGAWGKLKKTDYAYIDFIIKLMKLDNLIHKSYNKLSDGEKQKVLIARALVQDTRLIILDEPTAFLDLVNKNELFNLITRLSDNTNKIFIVSTHDVDIAVKYADEFWVIHNRKLLQMYPSADSKQIIYGMFGIANV
jgi:iron complex transport system ATP-binding protein